MKKVVKFGGSSLASAEQFKKVGNIIRKEESRRYVIPSAPGKRTPDDTKVTDMLYSCYGQAILGEDAERDFEEQLEAIKERYNKLQQENRQRLCGFPWRVSEWYHHGCISWI